MVHMKASVLNWNVRHEVLYTKMVSFGELAMEINVDEYGFNSIVFIVCCILIQIMVWLDWLVKMKIARKGLRKTKRRWRASNGLGAEERWLWWKREYLHLVYHWSSKKRLYYEEDQINVGSFDESDLVHLDVFIYMELDQVTCSRWLCSSNNYNGHVGILYCWRLKDMAWV
jgi:hypothetical protein